MDYLVNGFWAAFALLANMDDATFSAITATLVSTSYAMAASLLMGLPMGFALGYCDFPGKKVLRLISDTLLAFPTVLIGLLVYAFITYRGPLGEWGLLFTLPGMAIGQTLLALPIVMWVISIVARLGFKYLPLDMWRMPVDVRKGMVVCNGWLLKLTTLLVELECAATFCYVDIALYLGYAPLDAVMLAWLVALALSVWLPCRKAGRIGRGEAIWTANEDKQPE